MMTLLKSLLSSSRIAAAVRVGGVWEGAGIFGLLLLEAAGGGGCIVLLAAGLLGRLGGGVSPAALDGLGGCGGGTSSVALLGLGGCGGGASSSSRLVGSLGGPSSFALDGNLGGPFAVGKTGVEFTETSGILPLESRFPISGFGLSWPRRFGGGKSGSFAASKTGGSFLCVSTDEVLVLEDAVRDWVSDTPDTVELIDEFDPFRVNGLNPLRGGRAGDVSDAARPGRGGGNLRAGFGDGGAAKRGLPLSIRGGGRTFFLTPRGNSPPSCATEVPKMGNGALFVVWTRAGAAGRSGVGAAGRSREEGIGGGGLLPKVWCCLVCDWFRAAIRSWREVNWGSSTSAMAAERDVGINAALYRGSRVSFKRT